MAIYPIEFHRRAEQKWRRKSSPSVQIDRAESARRGDQCPHCGILAAEPFVSVHGSEGVVAHHWRCKVCKFDWNTRSFDHWLK